MNLYSKHYWKIEKYKQNFEKLLEYLAKMNESKEKTDLAMYAANYFIYNNTGYYTSSALEEYFVNCAKKIKVDLNNIQYKKNSILHILTNGYETGGHTRVIERWIENSPITQTHSVVQIKSTNNDLKTLQDDVKAKNGEFIILDNNLSLEEKAIKLRKLGMEYEYVILHTHMEDPTAIIAFGTEEFTRPVLFYNHASHLPWLGKSIADLVLDIKKDDEITIEKRKITNTYFLGVPSKEISVSTFNKTEIRKKLNLPTEKKIIVTSGGDFRFRKIGEKSFIDYLKNIMDDNTICYVIGIKPSNKLWKKEIKKSGKKIILSGFINFNDGFLDYLKSADLYLDSYPLPGGTAAIDAISAGTPCLSLKSILPQFDYLIQTSGYCNTEEEFISKSKKILNNENFAQNILKEEQQSLIENQSTEKWNNRIEKLYEIAPQKHEVKDLSKNEDYSAPNDTSVLCNVIGNKKFLKLKNIEILTDKKIMEIIKYGEIYKSQGIPYLFQIISFRKNDMKLKLLKLFNFPVFEWEK